MKNKKILIISLLVLLSGSTIAFAEPFGLGFFTMSPTFGPDYTKTTAGFTGKDVPYPMGVTALFGSTVFAGFDWSIMSMELKNTEMITNQFATINVFDGLVGASVPIADGWVRLYSGIGLGGYTGKFTSDQNDGSFNGFALQGTAGAYLNLGFFMLGLNAELHALKDTGLYGNFGVCIGLGYDSAWGMFQESIE